MRRFITIASGYAAAVVVAGFAMTAAYTVFDGLPKTAEWITYLAVLIFGTIFIAPFVALFSALPAALVVWQAERRGISSPVFYAVAGVATPVVVIGSAAALIALGSEPATTSKSLAINVAEWLKMFAIFGLPGLCAGLVYWAVAGRSAGC